MFAAAAREGLCGVVSFADPVVRRAADGRLVVPGHAGLIYQAKGAVALGRSDAATVLVLPDGTTLDRRALSKVRRGECGHEYVERRLAGSGGRGSPARRSWPGRCRPPAWSRCATAAATATGSALG